MSICEIEGCDNEANFIEHDSKFPVCGDHVMEVGPVSAIVKKTEDASGLIIFEENLTADGLEAILVESKTWPTVANSKNDYDLVYEQHQRFKRLSIAIRKKADELIKEAKSALDTRKSKIDKDLNFVLEIINPLIKRLGDSRQMYDDVKEAYKMNAAIDAAKIQEAEQARQEQIRATQRRIQEENDEDYALKMDYLRDEESAWSEHENQGAAHRQLIEDQRIEAERLKLARERYEFECDKSRLNREHAEIEAYRFSMSWAAESIAEGMNYNFDIEKSRLGFDEAWEYAHDPQNIDSVIKNYSGKGGFVSEYHVPTEQDQESTASIENQIKGYIDGNTTECEKATTIKAEWFEVPDDAKPVSTDSDALIISHITAETEEHLNIIDTYHDTGLSDPRLQIELNNFISRVKMNFKMFTDAVNR